MDSRLNPGGHYYGEYAIKNASYNGHLEIVEILLQDKRVEPSARKNPIEIPPYSSYLEIFANRIEASWDTAVLNALNCGHLEVVNKLLDDTRVDLEDRNHAVVVASETGYLEILNRLLQDERVDPSGERSNNLAIRRAATNGHLEVVNRLLEDDRVDPSAGNNQAIKQAAINGHLEVVNRLLQDKRVDPRGERNKAIMLAAKKGYLEIVNSLVQHEKVNLPSGQLRDLHRKFGKDKVWNKKEKGKDNPQKKK